MIHKTTAESTRLYGAELCEVGKRNKFRISGMEMMLCWRRIRNVDVSAEMGICVVIE